MALAQAADIDMAAPVGEPQRAVEQNVIDGEAAAPADRPKPWIRELVVGKHIIRSGQLEVTFPTRHKLPELPIVSPLNAGLDTAGSGAAVGKSARLKTEVRPHIGPGPNPIGRRRRGRSAGGRPARSGRRHAKVAGTRTGCDQHDRGYCPHQSFAHLTLRFFRLLPAVSFPLIDVKMPALPWGQMQIARQSLVILISTFRLSGS